MPEFTFSRHLRQIYLVLAQYIMKQQADQHHWEHYFEEGYHVFLGLQPYKQTYIKEKSHYKLVPKFYAPYRILQRIRQVGYRLALSTHFKLQLVFNVSCFKKAVGMNFQVKTNLPKLDEEGSICLQLGSTRKKIVSTTPVHSLGSLYTLEGYAAPRCHLRTKKNLTAISTPLALRTKLGRAC